MARPVTLTAFFFIALSLFAGTLQTTGVAEALHLDQSIGGDEAVNEARQTANQVDTGAPTGQTLFGMYNVLVKQLRAIFGILNPGLKLLSNAGVPDFIVGYYGPGTTGSVGLLPPLVTIVKFVGVASFLRGWGL